MAAGTDGDAGVDEADEEGAVDGKTAGGPATSGGTVVATGGCDGEVGDGADGDTAGDGAADIVDDCDDPPPTACSSLGATVRRSRCVDPFFTIAGTTGLVDALAFGFASCGASAAMGGRDDERGLALRGLAVDAAFGDEAIVAEDDGDRRASEAARRGGRIARLGT